MRLARSLVIRTGLMADAACTLMTMNQPIDNSQRNNFFHVRGRTEVCGVGETEFHTLAGGGLRFVLG